MDKITAASSVAQTQAAKAAGAATGAGMSIPTILMGAQMDALFIGLAAAVFVSVWLEQIDSRIKVAAAVLFSALLAGYGSPVLARYIADALPVIAADSDALRMLTALLIGACTPSLFPLLLRMVAKKGGAA